MKVQEFIETFKVKKIMDSKINEHAVADYLKETLDVKEYLPFAEKRELCAKVLNACNKIDSNGLVKVDSVSRYIIFTVSILSAYTNLEFSSGEDEIDSIDEYDMLCQSGLFDPILEVIGNEYAVCNNILNMMMDDIVANNNTVENVVSHTLNKLSKSIDGFIDTLSDKVDELNLDLNQIDIDKYKGLIEQFTQK